MSDKDKEALKEVIVAVVEVLDDNIPIIGKLFMDTPIIDKLEKECVSSFVDTLLSTREIKDDLMPWSA